MRPKLSVERAMLGEIRWEELPRMPHCEPRILHLPEECEFCANAKYLQREREELGVSNTGHRNREWSCPADKARSSENQNAWHGNRAVPKKGCDRT